MHVLNELLLCDVSFEEMIGNYLLTRGIFRRCSVMKMNYVKTNLDTGLPFGRRFYQENVAI